VARLRGFLDADNSPSRRCGPPRYLWIRAGFRWVCAAMRGSAAQTPKSGLVAQRSRVVCRLAALVMACSYACCSSKAVVCGGLGRVPELL
jgi:hypothetical protein